MGTRQFAALLIFVVGCVASVTLAGEVGPAAYQIVEREGGWQLLRAGAPFYVKGAVGWESYDLLRRCGANSVRTGANKAGLDRVHAAGLTALVNLPVRGERNKMNWDDDQMVAEQEQRVLQTVREWKDHPAVMFWAVGNELDWIPPGVPPSPRLWQRLNALAAKIRALDPHHPVMTVVGTGRYEQKIQEIARQCPDMDLLGINAYGDLAEVTESTRKYWPKPYVVAEWGPTGHWQVPKTQWRVPLEETSTEKAQATYQRYTQVIQADKSHCLGSYVFLWGQKQETTHTWYGLFQDGLATESIDVMTYLWSGSWPSNRAPAVLAVDIVGHPDKARIYLPPAQACEARAVCYDVDHDPLVFQWDIRPEVVIPKDSYAGGGEKPAVPIPGLIQGDSAARIRFVAPPTEGAYRLFVQVRDGNGHVGNGNVPFYVRPEARPKDRTDSSRSGRKEPEHRTGASLSGSPILRVGG